jgi:hypothetical protein
MPPRSVHTFCSSGNGCLGDGNASVDVLMLAQITLTMSWNTTGTETPLHSISHALGMAESMTYKGVHPQASLHEGGNKGVRLKMKAMKVLEQGLERRNGLKKWFVKFVPSKAKTALDRLASLNL